MLTITLLGTAATMPLPERALTAAVAECGGHSLSSSNLVVKLIEKIII